MRAALVTWNGGGTDYNWGTPANWGGTAPVNGDDLVFSGATRLNSSNSIIPLRINSLSYTSSGFTNFGQALMITNGIVDIAGNNTNIVGITLGGSQSISNQSGLSLVLSGAINMSNYNLTVSSSGGGSLFLNGAISGNGLAGVNSLNVYDGFVRLGAANTFNGDVSVNSGILRLGNAGSIPSGNGRGNLNIAAGATLDLGGQSPTVNGLNGDGLIDTTNNVTFTLGAANSNGVFAGIIQNTLGILSLVKNGSGTQTNSGNNTYAGSTTVNGGRLVLSAGNSYFGSTIINNGGQLILDPLGTIASTNINIAPGGVFDVSAVFGGFLLNGNLIAGRTSGFTNDYRGDLTLQGGNMTVVPGLAGTLTLAGNLTLSGGTLNFDLNTVTTVGVGVNDLINLTNGGNLNINGLTLVKIKPIAGSFSGGTYTLISGSTADVAGSAASLQLAAPRGVTAVFDTATQPKNLLVTAAGTPNPASIIWAGNGSGGAWDVQVSQNWLSNGVPDYFYDLDTVTFNDAAGTANGTVSMPNAVSPTFTTVNNSAFNFTLGVPNSDPGLITGTGGLTKNGTGSLILNSLNNFTGPTTVNGGAIVLGNFTTGNLGVNQIVLYNGVTPGTVVLGNGGFFMTGVANTQEIIEFGLLTINPGGSSLAARGRQANATPYWTVDNISRNIGGTLDMNGLNQRTGSHCGIYFTNPVPLTVNGILGGYVTWNLNDWLVPLNTLVGALPYATYQVNATSSLWGALSNVNVTASPSAIASSQVINSMRIPAAANVTISAGQSLTLASGGLLVPNNATGSGTITGGTLLGATNADLIILQNNAANNLTIGSVIADNTNGAALSGSALTKAGQGTAILTGNNTYSGITYINGATLSGNNNGNNLPTTIAAGTLQIGNGGTSGGISNSPSVANNGTLAFSRSDTVGYSGLISGTGGVKQQGSGTSVLTANNTYSGVTTITAGTLQIGNGGASGSFNNSASVANAGTLLINRTGTLGYAGQISGIGTLAVTGGATLILGTNETYSGSTVISNGKLVLAAGASLSNSASIVVAAGAVLDASAAGGIILNSQVLTGSGGYVGDVTSGAGTRISPNGDGLIGTLTLSNALTLNGGTVTIDINGASRDLLDVKGNLNLTSGTIALNNLGAPIANGTYKVISYSGVLTGGAANLSISGFSQFGQLASLSDATAGEIDLVVVTYNANDLIWQGDGANNFWDTSTKDWTNSSGTLTNFHQFDIATFDDTSVNTSVHLVGNLQPGQITVNGSVNSYIFQGAGQLASGNLIMNNPNTLTILTTNTSASLTTINAGTVQLGNGVTAGTLGSGNVANNSALVFNQPDNRTFSGAMNGPGSVTILAGGLTFSGNNTGFSGPITINGGSLSVGSGGAAGTLGTGPVTNNTSLVINRSGALTVDSSITGSGSLTNVGAGTATLNGVNTYGGPTAIPLGTIKAGSTGAIPSGTGAGNVILDGGAAAAGVLDLNGFNVSINGLDGVNGTVLGRVLNNSGTATNTLTLITIDPTNTFSGTIRDNSGSGGKVALVKTGTGSQILEITTSVGNLYTGGTIISNGVLMISTPGGANPVVIGANSVAFGSGPVTFYGGTLSLAGSFGQNNGPTWGPSVNTFVVPAGQTGTVHPPQRGTCNSALTGSGTFTYVAAYVRGYMGGNWSAFTGQIILSGDSNGSLMGLDTAIGMPNARVFMTNGITLFGHVAGTPTIPIGELAGGDDSTSIVSTSPAGAGGLAANFMVGGLNTSTNYDGRIGDSAGLIKVGTGTLLLTNANINYSGITTVSNGALVFVGAIPNSPTWTLASPGVLDISSNTASTTLNVGSAAVQTIRGNGTLNGSLSLGSSGVAVVGFTNTIGTLTVTNDVNLSGTTYMELNVTNAVGGTNDQIACATITLGGTLTVTNIGSALHVGDTFKLFKASGPISGTIGTVNLPLTDGNNMGYTWTDNTAVNGSITVLTAFTLVNTTPTNIDVTVSGNQLTLTWPVDHTGWRLQAQTNSVTTGLSGNWVDVTGSTTVNTLTFTINPADGAVFYRMVYP